MEALKRFTVGALKIGVSLAVAVLLIAGAVWGVVEARDGARQRAEAPLALKKVWPRIAAEPLGNVHCDIATVWREGKIYYRVQVDGYSPSIATAKETASKTAAFTFVFSDKDGFKLFQKQVSLSQMISVVGSAGRPSGLDWADSEYVDAESYRNAATVDLQWSGFSNP
jgi:hypothetical protein